MSSSNSNATNTNANNKKSNHQQSQQDDSRTNNMLLTMASAAPTPAAASSNKKQIKLLPASWIPSKYDIICGRGSIALQHEGNVRLKALVQSMLPEYNQSACKFQKSKLVSSIVHQVHQASPEGGFVKFVDDGWVKVTERHAREKVGQLFRDALHTKYKSSTKSKSKVRRDLKRNSGSANGGGSDSRCDSPASLTPSTSSAQEQQEATTTTTTKALALHHQVIQQAPLGCSTSLAPLPIPSSITCLDRPLRWQEEHQESTQSARPPSPVMSKKWNKFLSSPNSSSSSSSAESSTSLSLLPSTSLMSLTQHSLNRSTTGGSFSFLNLPNLQPVGGAGPATIAAAAVPATPTTDALVAFENDLENHFLSMTDPLVFLNQINDDNIDQVCDYLYDQL